jgi:hypothetical protein
MEVKHGLPGLRSGVDHQPIASRHTFLLCHLTSHDE